MMPIAPDPRTTVILLFVAAIVAIVARRLSLPATVGLLITGFALALLGHLNPQVGLDPRTLLTVLLPPLVFEGALNIRWPDMKRDLPLLLALTTTGVVAGCLLVAAGMHALDRWGWPHALLFGAIIAATDPIAVLASLKDAGVRGRPRLLLEAESLMNDGTAVVLYTILQGYFTASGHVDHGVLTVVGAILRVVGGSLVCGLLVGALMTFAAGKSADALTETTLTVVAAYGAYYVADRIFGSGILATLAAGLVMGNVGVFGTGYVTDRGREVAEALWEFGAFVANSLVFLLMGMYLGHVPHESVVWGLIPTAIVIGLAGRAVTVYATCIWFQKTRFRVPMLQQHLLFWGGQRGGLTLVLALTLAEGSKYADNIITAAIAVVAFSVLVQGLTFRPLVRAAIPRPALSTDAAGE